MFIEGSREVALKKFVVVDGFGYNSTDKLEIVQVVWGCTVSEGSNKFRLNFTYFTSARTLKLVLEH